ncbi:NTF2-related export protein 2 isoform X1 [Ornithorhynchus anatinus]|uniref:NTF2-related export protein 2 isoform X1 n=1 Tax=Ornithorhynchus anatinus TaxID=9258 RepID=UPI0019D4E285|nr:NTF2-related export protein 2 isoform X1 [Ornithorhynchus anatinus]
MAASVDFKTYVEQACRAAEEFANIYYETMDKRRRVLTRLYLDKATLVWNGNAISGQEALSEFFEMLPSSEFQINTLDCQPVHVSQYNSCFIHPTSETKKLERSSPVKSEPVDYFEADGQERLLEAEDDGFRRFVGYFSRGWLGRP